MSGEHTTVAVLARGTSRSGALAVAPACAVAGPPLAHETRDLAALSTRPILVIESDATIAKTLVEQLASDGYQAELARTAEHARARAKWSTPRLVLLGDLGCSRGSLELLEEIRRKAHKSPLWAPEVPIIVIGTSLSELEMLRAFETGADDFLARPARYLELRARIRALLRRSEAQARRADRLAVGTLEIDMRGRAVSVNGLSVHLRRLEFDLLAHLADEPERVFAKHELLRAVWGYRSTGSTRTVDSHASRLRRKLEQHGGRWVVNEWGVGYRLH